MKNLITCLFLLCSIHVFALKPVRDYWKKPDAFNIPFSEYKVTTPDQYQLNVWNYSLKEGAALGVTVILVGSDAGNISYMIWQANALREKGIRVIAFDYRGFGGSDDFEIKPNNLFHKEFALDLDTVIRDTRAKYPNEKIGLFGLSMGSYISLIRQEPVNFLVADGFYFSPRDVVQRIKKVKNNRVDLPVGTAKVNRIHPRVPVLIFATTGDEITVAEDARQFGQRNDVELIVSEGEHLASMMILTKDQVGDIYAEKIREFLKKKVII